MVKRVKIEDLKNEAHDWFVSTADAVFKIDRGPDIQHVINPISKESEIWTTSDLTPERSQHCKDVLRHNEGVEQSVWLCDTLAYIVNNSFYTRGEKGLLDIGYFCLSSFSRDANTNRSEIQTRRWDTIGSVLIISICDETFCTLIPKRFIHDFAALQIETEENVSYLCHFLNTV